LVIGLASKTGLWIYNNLTQQTGLFDFLKEYKTVPIPFVKHKIKPISHLLLIDEENNWYL
jgi:hypothetical protein